LAHLQALYRRKKSLLASITPNEFSAVFHAFYSNQRAVLGNSHHGNLFSIGEPSLGIQGVHQLDNPLQSFP
jgi:hypothetical protein